MTAGSTGQWGGRTEYFEVSFLHWGPKFTFWGRTGQGLNNSRVSSPLAFRLPLQTLFRALAVRERPHPFDPFGPVSVTLSTCTRLDTHQVDGTLGCRPQGAELAPQQSSSASRRGLAASASSRSSS